MLMDSLRENADQLGIVLPLGNPNIEQDGPSNDSLCSKPAPMPIPAPMPPRQPSPTIGAIAPPRIVDFNFGLPPPPPPITMLNPPPMPPQIAPAAGNANANLIAAPPLVLFPPFQQQLPLPFPGTVYNPIPAFMKCVFNYFGLLYCLFTNNFLIYSHVLYPFSMSSGPPNGAFRVPQNPEGHKTNARFDTNSIRDREQSGASANRRTHVLFDDLSGTGVHYTLYE